MINGFCRKYPLQKIIVNSVIEYLHPELYGILFLAKILTVLVIKEDGKIIIFV
jgi:hypothetical protein